MYWFSFFEVYWVVLFPVLVSSSGCSMHYVIVSNGDVGPELHRLLSSIA